VRSDAAGESGCEISVGNEDDEVKSSSSDVDDNDDDDDDEEFKLFKENESSEPFENTCSSSD
jgi:hypothetical protein